MKITVMTADEQILTLDVDRDESVIYPRFSLSTVFLFLVLSSLITLFNTSPHPLQVENLKALLEVEVSFSSFLTISYPPNY